ncbi:MAG TPA: hypothetical protein VLH19_00745 [Patescibacteria group bacterium]|nr:hypothetical protein [Patescibacteria group bacterium]
MAQLATFAPAFLYVEPNRLSMYTGNGSIATLDLPLTSVKDLDIVSKDELVGLLTKFIDEHKTHTYHLYILLSPAVVFEKDFPTLPGDEREKQTNQFLDTVPFERVLSRSYSLPSGWKAVATNRDLYDLLRDTFELAGSQMAAVLPPHVYTALGMKSFDVETGRALLKRIDTVKDQTLAVIRHPLQSLQQKENELAQKHTPLLIFVFFLFMLFVILVTFTMLRSQATPAKKPTPVPKAIPKMVATPIATPFVASPSAVKVFTASGSATPKP